MADTFTPPPLSSHQGPAPFTPPSTASHQGPADSSSFLNDLWQEGVVNPAKQIAAGAVGASASTNRLFANTADMLDSAATHLSNVTGLPKGGLFQELGTWFRGAQHAQEQQAQQLSGGRQDFPSQVFRGGTQGIAELPTYALGTAALGPVGGMAAISGLRESDQGVIPALTAAA